MARRVRCPHCGSDVEALAHCGVCGRPLPQRETPTATGLRARIESLVQPAREQPVRTALIVTAVVIFLVLLGGRAGPASVVGLLVVPALLGLWLTRLDVFEREPWGLTAAATGAGAVAGLLGGWLMNIIYDRWWFSETRLNIGAVGFPGVAANGEGGVPFGVLLLNGILVPALLGAAVLGGPVFLRRWNVFRNEVLDGMTLGGLAAAGYATLTAIVYFWPALAADLPDRPVSEWTAIIAGITVVRPVVLVLAGALLGAAIWNYFDSRDLRSVVLPAAGGLVGWFGLAIGSLAFAQAGAVTEFIWYLIVLVIVGFAFREALARGLAADRANLDPIDGQPQVVCPNCHRVTPDGAFCSFCGASLRDAASLAAGAVAPSAAGAATGQGVRTEDADRSDATSRTSGAASDEDTDTGGRADDPARQTDSRDEAVIAAPAGSAVSDNHQPLAAGPGTGNAGPGFDDEGRGFSDEDFAPDDEDREVRPIPTPNSPDPVSAAVTTWEIGTDAWDGHDDGPSRPNGRGATDRGGTSGRGESTTVDELVDQPEADPLDRIEREAASRASDGGDERPQPTVRAWTDETDDDPSLGYPEVDQAAEVDDSAAGRPDGSSNRADAITWRESSPGMDSDEQVAATGQSADDEALAEQPDRSPRSGPTAAFTTDRGAGDAGTPRDGGSQSVVPPRWPRATDQGAPVVAGGETASDAPERDDEQPRNRSARWFPGDADQEPGAMPAAFATPADEDAALAGTDDGRQAEGGVEPADPTELDRFAGEGGLPVDDTPEADLASDGSRAPAEGEDPGRGGRRPTSWRQWGRSRGPGSEQD